MKNFRRLVRTLVAVAAVFVVLPCARANTTNIWNGGGGSASVLWNNGANWGGTPPGPGSQLIFTNTASLVSINNFTNGFVFAGITFANPAGAFVLNGNSITLTNNISDLQPVTPETVNLPLILTNNWTLAVKVVTNGVLNLTNISGSGGITVSGGGTVGLNGTLNGSNSFTGNLQVNGATLAVAVDPNLGTTNDLGSFQAGRLVLNNGVLSVTTNMTLNANRGITLGSPSAAGASGFIKVASGSILNNKSVMADNTGGASAFTKDGFGNLILSQTQTYTGATTNLIGTLTLDFSQASSPGSDIINAGSSLSMGGGNAGSGAVNFAQLTMAGKSATANSQSFTGTHLTFGASILGVTNGGGGGTATLNLGTLGHDRGGTMTLFSSTPGSGASVTTTSANNNGILGGWATIAGVGGAPFVPTVNLITGTNYATVDNGGNIVDFTSYFVYGNQSQGTLHNLVDANVTGVETNVLADVSQNGGAALLVMVDTNGGPGKVTDVNSFKFYNNGGTLHTGDGIFVGTNNTLRLGTAGGMLFNNGTGSGATMFIGTLTEVVPANTAGAHNHVGYMTAGGPNNNTPGEIVVTVANNSETAGTVRFDTIITDNGSGSVAFVKQGPGSIKLDSHNTFSGGLYLLQGRVQFTGTEDGNPEGNPDGGGTGPIYVLPGCYLFPSGLVATNFITNAVFIAGSGDAAEPLGATRGGNYSGPMTMIGDTTLGGNANVAGPISGAFNLTVGSGATVNGGASLAGAGDNWTGNTIIAARSDTGNNTMTSSNSEVIPNGFGFGNVSMVSFATGTAWWNLNGFNETVNGLSSTTVGAGGNSVITNAAAGTSLLTVGDNDQSGTFGGLIIGRIALTKIGAGVETLTNANTYIGNTTISNGVLQLAGSASIASSPAVNVYGGTFDVASIAGGSYSIPATQTINVSSGTFFIGSANATSGSINFTNGTLALNKMTVGGSSLTVPTVNFAGLTNIIQPVNIPLIGLYPTTFPLVNYTTTLNGYATVGLSLPPNYGGYISNDAPTKTIYLVLTNGIVTPFLTWVGYSGGSPTTAWDLSTVDWTNTATHLMAPYADGSLVTFDDSSSNSTVSLNIDVFTAGLTVTNAAKNYLFIGAGAIRGTNGITKLGSGKLTFDNSGINDFSAALTIGAGTVQVGVQDGNGSLGGGSVSDGGLIVFNRAADTIVPNIISGSGSLLFSNTAGTTVQLNGNNSFSGAVFVTNSILQLGNNAALGATNGGTTIADGAALDINGRVIGSEPVTVTGSGPDAGVNNGGLYNSSSDITGSRALARVTLAGDTVIGGNGRFDIGSSTGVSGSPSTASLSLTGTAHNLVKAGPNWVGIVSATVDPLLGSIDVQSGILDLEGNITGLGITTSNLYVRNGATLTLFSVTNVLNKQFQFGVATSDNSILTSGSGNNTIIGPMSLNGSVSVTVTNGSLTLSNAISGAGGITKEGSSGTLTIAGTDTHSGGFIINDGTLIYNSTNSNTGPNSVLTAFASAASQVTVGGNGSFKGAVDIEDTFWAGVAGSPATFTVGNNVDYVNPTTGDPAPGAFNIGGLGSGNEAIFSLNTATNAGGGVNDLLNVTGNFNVNNAKVLINPLTPLSGGSTYTLVNYSGALNSTFGQASILPTLQPARYRFTLNQGSGHVTLTVNTGAGALRWNNAAGTGVWDVTNSFNWFNANGGTNDYFAELDSVVFDDTVSATPANTNVLLSAFSALQGTNSVNVGLRPITLSVLATNNNYVFMGSGKISGPTSLAKRGPATLVMSNANDFTGTVTLNGGKTVLNNNQSLGLSSVVYVTNGATLDVGGSTLSLLNAGSVNITNPIIISGWGVNSNGVIVSGSTNTQINALHFITLAGDAAIGGPGIPNGPGRWDIRNAGANASLSVNGNSTYTLYKVGGSQVSLVSATVDTNLGNIDIQGGMLGFESGTATMGNPLSNLTVEAGTILEFFGNTTNVFTKQFKIIGDGVTTNLNQASGSVTLKGNMTLSNICGIGGAGTSITNSAIISGTGGWIKTGSNAFAIVLTSTNTYTGNTIVNTNGTLILLGGGSISSSSNLLVAGGATVNVLGRTDRTLTIAAGKSLTGSGTIAGTLTNLGTVSPGTNAVIGTLTVTTNAVLSGTTFLKINGATSASDLISAGVGVTIGGTLNISNVSVTVPTNGQSFKLFNAAIYTTNYTGIVPSTPGPSLAWDTTLLTSNGTLRVVSSGPPPTPRITVITLSGTTLSISATNGLSGNTWTLLQSTNVALPFAQWGITRTGSFDGNGNMSTNIANVVTNNLQMFYILKY